MRNLLIGVMGIALGQAAHGALSSCVPSTTFTAASSTTVLTTGSAIPVAGAPSPTANDLSSLAGAGGCALTDFNFSNFAGTFSGNGTGNNVGTFAGTYFSGNNSLNVVTTPDQLTLSTIRGTVSTSTDGDPNDGTNNWFSNSNGAAHVVDDVVGFTIQDVNTTLSLTSLTLTLNGTEFNGTQSFTVRYCEDGTVQLLDSTHGCTGGGTLHTITLSPLTTGATPVQSQTFTVNLATPITNLSNVLDFSIEISLAGGSAGANSGFDSLGIGLTEVAPEPATFVLIGTALAGIGFLRRRKKS